MAIIFDAAMGGAQIELAGPGGKPGLVIAERQTPQRILAETAWTKGGKQIRWEKPVKSVPLTLRGGDNWGWIDTAAVDALYAMADDPNPATPYVLDYEGTLYDVFWRFEEPPVIEAEQIVPSIAAGDYWRNIALKFMRMLA